MYVTNIFDMPQLNTFSGLKLAIENIMSQKYFAIFLFADASLIR